MTKTTLITGIADQEGSFLAEPLLDEGYEVRGIVRRSSSLNTARIDQYMRSSEVDHLLGDVKKATERLGWKPKLTFEDLVARMVDADLMPLGVGGTGSETHRKEAV